MKINRHIKIAILSVLVFFTTESYAQLATEPSTQLTSISVSQVSSTVTISWDRGNGSEAIIVAAETKVGANPDDETTYTANSIFGLGSEIGNDNFVVYKGNGTNVDVSNLLANTTYQFYGYEFNGSAGTENYFTAKATGNPNTFTTDYSEPTSQATITSITSLGQNAMTINWSDGDGTSTIVAVRASDIGSSPTPVNKTNYPASPDFSTLNSSSQIGSSGYYVIYNGTGSSAALNGLSTDTPYFIEIFTYNGTSGAENYLVSHEEINMTSQPTLDTEPTQQASGVGFSNVTHEQMDISWTAAGDGSIVLVRESSAVADAPTDASTYTANANYSDGDAIGTSYVAYSGPASTFTLTGLNHEKTYHVEVFSYNNSPGEINYNISGTGNTGSQATTTAPAPTIQASNIVITPTGTSTLTIAWDNGNGDSLIVAVRESTQGTIINPSDDNSYSASSDWNSKADQLGTSSGYYIVYNGSESSISLTNLTAGTSYWVQIFEYNNSPGNEKYNINTATNNPLSGSTFKAEPSTHASALTISSIKHDGMTVSCTAGNGDYRIITASIDQIYSTPTDGETYTANLAYETTGTEIGGDYVVYNGSGTSAIVTGLNEGTTYYFTVYEYNNTGTNTNYNTTSAPSVPGTTIGLATWLGVDENNLTAWDSINNWSIGAVPTSSHDVVIPATSHQPIITFTKSVANITIESGAHLTILSGATLNVSGDALLESPSGTHGSPGMIVLKGSLNVSGTATIQRYITDNKWHLFGSPVIGWNSSAVINDYYFAYYNEPTSAWTRIRNSQTMSNIGKGYEMIRNQDGANLITLSGSNFNSGDVTVPITNTYPETTDDGWNIISNPYPSTYDLSALNMNGNIEASIQVLVNGVYKSYNTFNGTGDNTVKDIAPMQGFFVRAIVASASVTFSSNKQTNGQIDYKSEQNTKDNKAITLAVASEKYSSSTYFTFYEDATKNYDSKYDGVKWIGFNDSIPEVYSYMNDSTILSINSFPLDTITNFANLDVLKYKIGVKKGISTQLTFSLSQLEKLPENFDIILFDKVEDKQTNLLNQDYSFTTGDTDDSTRFELLLIPNIIQCNSINIESTLTNDSIEIEQNTTFTAIITPEDASIKEVIWSVNDDQIASIDSLGLLTAYQEGIVTITATTTDGSNLSNSYKISIYAPIILVNSIEIWHKNTNDTIAPDNTLQLYATLLPENASDKTITWSISNNEIASIDSISGKLTTKSNGQLIVYAKCKDNSELIDSMLITITTQVTFVESIEIISPEDSIDVNYQLQLSTNVLPANATNSTISWSSSDTELATVDNSGLVTSKAKGNVIIYAISNDNSGISDSILITIYKSITLIESIEINSDSDSVLVNGQIQLYAYVLPANATDSTINWSTSDIEIATVDNIGLVTGQQDGIVTITASSNDGSGIYSELLLTVYTITGIDFEDNKIFANVYPNPTLGEVTIETNANKCSYTIYDNVGKIMVNNTLFGKTNINISQFESGVYFVEFMIDGERKVKLLIKN